LPGRALVRRLIPISVRAFEVRFAMIHLLFDIHPRVRNCTAFSDPA
jgi:hypothetical protein